MFFDRRKFVKDIIRIIRGISHMKWNAAFFCLIFLTIVGRLPPDNHKKKSLCHFAGFNVSNFIEELAILTLTQTELTGKSFFAFYSPIWHWIIFGGGDSFST